MKNIIIILIPLLFLACNKRSTTEFTSKGMISDSKTGLPVENVKLEIYTVETSGINSGYTKINTTYSDASGNYSTTYNRTLVEAYNFSFSRSGYFPEDDLINFDNLTTSDDNVLNKNLKPRGWIQFNIINQNSPEAGDELKIYKEGGDEFCEGCLSQGFYFFNGANIDTNWTIPSVAQEYFVFRYWDLLGSTYHFDSLMINQNDTVTYSIIY